MGIFDDVTYKCKCPKCGADVDGFQTKDNDPCLNRVGIDEISRWYTSCNACKYWIEWNWKTDSITWDAKREFQTVVRHIEEKCPYAPELCLPVWMEREE